MEKPTLNFAITLQGYFVEWAGLMLLLCYGIGKCDWPAKATAMQ